MALTDSMTEIAQHLHQLLETNSTLLGIQDVFYGDQDRIPRVPAVCVEPGDKRRELNGAPRRTLVTITNYIIVYHFQVTNVRDVRELNDGLAENIETVIHVDASLGGLAIDSMVIGIESGYQIKKNSLFRASRLAVEARSQVQLPSSV